MVQSVTRTTQPIVASSDTGTTLTDDYNNFMETWLSNHSGASAPQYAVEGTAFFHTGQQEMQVNTATGWQRLLMLPAGDASATVASEILATATQSVKGAVRLSDSVSLNSGVADGIAATPKAVKSVQDVLTQTISAVNDKMAADATLDADRIVSGVFEPDRIPVATGSEYGAIKMSFSGGVLTLTQ